jgi:polyvinyl alcohol dehydrogenase (cytochrome)
MGGVQWGSAADASNAYVALSDIGRITLTNTLATDADPKRGGGVFALRVDSTTNGAILWDVDTAVPYQTVNGVPARGGSLNGPGPAIAGGMLFTNSGYVNAGGMPGNVLLAFSVDGK